MKSHNSLSPFEWLVLQLHSTRDLQTMYLYIRFSIYETHSTLSYYIISRFFLFPLYIRFTSEKRHFILESLRNRESLHPIVMNVGFPIKHWMTNLPLTAVCCLFTFHLFSVAAILHSFGAVWLETDKGTYRAFVWFALLLTELIEGVTNMRNCFFL